ncbi:MAG: TolC family protein [Prevotella sp.]|nr:TolC family protein [Prevotella sp.]
MKQTIMVLCLLPTGAGAQTLDECQAAAGNNYPLVKKYELISKTTDLTLSNIGKGWWPKISAAAQATWQNEVVKLPDALSDMMERQGMELKGLAKDQYRLGIDISQTVYDGGTIRSQKNMARWQGKVQQAQNEVDIYAVKKRVNELYFGILLLEERLKANADLQELLASNEQKLADMFKLGVAAESDYHTVVAERLSAIQTMTELQSQKRMLLQLLGVFCGMEIRHLSKPAGECTNTQNNRPELKWADAQLKLADAQAQMLHANLLPKVSVFATGFYGYPGFDMYKDMFRHRFTLNAMIGAKVSWNIGALYTLKNDREKIRLQKEQAENFLEVFLFNNRMEQMQKNENVAKYKELMANQERIIALRSSVRKAAESKLAHGIIDVNDLVREINNENMAKIQLSTHEIEMLKQIYDLKYTVNN